MSDSKPPAFCVSGRTLTLLVLGCWVFWLISGCDGTKYRTDMRAYKDYQESVEICWGHPEYEKCMKSRGWLAGGDYAGRDYEVVED